MPTTDVMAPGSTVVLRSLKSTRSPTPVAPSSSPPVRPASTSGREPDSLRAPAGSLIFTVFSSVKWYRPSGVALRGPTSVRFLTPS